MTRSKFIAIPLGLVVAATVLPGCAKSDGATPHAETPIGDIKAASIGAPGPDMTYLTDQSQIKLVSVPTVSYEPLATFRTAKPAGESAAAHGDDEGDDAASGGGGGGGIMSKAKMALASLAGGLMGGGGPPRGMPPMPIGDAGDGMPSVNLADMRDPLAALPEHPSNVTGEPVETAKNAAVTLAKEHLAKRIFSMRLNPEKTIGEAIGPDADPKSMQFSSAVIVGAKWLTPNKLEVEIMCSVADIASELESKFSSLDLSVVKAMGQGKGLSAKGTGDLKHEQGGARRARPGEMSRQAAEEGGLGG